ncbi:MAG: glycosyltransferase family 61 protein [Candidatus Methylacidiphilales bacterium]|nr:glycosyltransferase family 61 protein [Candidatus Methylacidiphilales bacterium]
MAEINPQTRWLNRLRRWGGLYLLLRAVRRILSTVWVESFRRFGCGPCWGAARGFYSGLADIREGRTEGGVLLEGQSLPVLPAVSLIERARMDQNGRQPWPVFWSRLPSARLVGPSLAVMGPDKKLMIESVYGEEFCRRDPSYLYSRLGKPVRLPGRWTSVIHSWSEGYYHWITDALPRLAPLEEWPSDVGILMRGPLRSYQKESLEMLGLLERVRETVEDHLLVEEYFFSSPVGMTGCTNPYAVGWLRRRFLPFAAPGESPPFFCIRRRGKTRGIRNQESLWTALAAQGWGVVDMETLSFAEQMGWFARARAVVGEHGAAFTNLVWTGPGCAVLELCAEGFLNGCYEGIMRCVGGRHDFHIHPSRPDCSFEVPSGSLQAWVESVSPVEKGVAHLGMANRSVGN